MSSEEKEKGTVGEVARLFLWMGATAFGGPAAHIAVFREEVVKRRGWITEEHFLDMWGASNLIPGPSSTEMAIHIGYVRAGGRGLIAAGVCFILPAFLIVLGLAWLYVEYGTTPAAEGMLYGLKPVVVAVIAQAIWGLTGKAVKTRLLGLMGIAAFILYLVGVNELLILFGGGLLVMMLENLRRLEKFGMLMLLAAEPSEKAPYSLEHLFLTFLKIGSVLYGSGYVLLAFLRGDLVDRLGWLTEQQLLDAVAIGQFTPGPLFTTATFIGYVVGGVPGAVAATLGIFLPSFLLVLLTNPLIPAMRRSPWLSALLDGVNVTALGLMAGVLWDLGRVALNDGVTVILALVAAVLLLRYKVNSTWLIVGGGVIGLVVHELR